MVNFLWSREAFCANAPEPQVAGSTPSLRIKGLVFVGLVHLVVLYCESMQSATRTWRNAGNVSLTITGMIHAEPDNMFIVESNGHKLCTHSTFA